MKRIVALICLILIAMLPVANAEICLNGTFGSENRNALEVTRSILVPVNDKHLTSTEDFVYYFNFFGAFNGNGHKLSIGNTSDLEEIGDEILFKTIFNDCEILTLMLSQDASKVNSIMCTWAKNMPGAGNYLNDFLQMLMESLLACGMESDSVSSLFTELGKNTFSVGDEGEMSIDGMKVSYNVTSYAGVTFTIECE